MFWLAPFWRTAIGGIGTFWCSIRLFYQIFFRLTQCSWICCLALLDEEKSYYSKALCTDIVQAFSQSVLIQGFLYKVRYTTHHPTNMYICTSTPTCMHHVATKCNYITMSSIQAAHERTNNLPDQNDRCGDAESSIVPSQGQGHRLRRLLIAQVAHSGCGSRVTDNPNWFQASRYSILHSSLSSAESRYHCLVIDKMMSRFENTSVGYWTFISLVNLQEKGIEQVRVWCSICRVRLFLPTTKGFANTRRTHTAASKLWKNKTRNVPNSQLVSRRICIIGVWRHVQFRREECGIT